MGWQPDPGSPAYRVLVSAVAALERLGYPCDTAHLLPYARLAVELAVHDLDVIEEYESAMAQVEAVVALTVLYEPVLLAFRRLAHADESARRPTRWRRPTSYVSSRQPQ